MTYLQIPASLHIGTSINKLPERVRTAVAYHLDPSKMNQGVQHYKRELIVEGLAIDLRLKLDRIQKPAAKRKPVHLAFQNKLCTSSQSNVIHLIGSLVYFSVIKIEVN